MLARSELHKKIQEEMLQHFIQNSSSSLSYNTNELKIIDPESHLELANAMKNVLETIDNTSPND